MKHITTKHHHILEGYDDQGKFQIRVHKGLRQLEFQNNMDEDFEESLFINLKKGDIQDIEAFFSGISNAKKFTQSQLKDAITATIKGMIAWIESDKVICQDKTTGVKIPNSEIGITDKYSIFESFVCPELEKIGIKYVQD